jgi:hypothetical protein
MQALFEAEATLSFDLAKASLLTIRAFRQPLAAHMDRDGQLIRLRLKFGLTVRANIGLGH